MGYKKDGCMLLNYEVCALRFPPSLSIKENIFSWSTRLRLSTAQLSKAPPPFLQNKTLPSSIPFLPPTNPTIFEPFFLPFLSYTIFSFYLYSQTNPPPFFPLHYNLFFYFALTNSVTYYFFIGLLDVPKMFFLLLLSLLLSLLALLLVLLSFTL
eukprot:m.60527 g.60527  ORF g.60527 m.60527 type:complete len:154 (+) comp7948_c0_seq2:3234-3695(+)